MFGPSTEDYPAQQRTDVVDDRNLAHRRGRKAVILLKKRRVEVLRAVAERVERKHQQHEEQKTSEISDDIFAKMAFCLSGHSPSKPRGRFFYLGANVDDQKRRKRADHKHAAPANVGKQDAVRQSRQQITHNVSL